MQYVCLYRVVVPHPIPRRLLFERRFWTKRQQRTRYGERRYYIHCQLRRRRCPIRRSEVGLGLIFRSKSVRRLNLDVDVSPENGHRNICCTVSTGGSVLIRARVLVVIFWEMSMRDLYISFCDIFVVESAPSCFQRMRCTSSLNVYIVMNRRAMS